MQTQDIVEAIKYLFGFKQIEEDEEKVVFVAIAERRLQLNKQKVMRVIRILNSLNSEQDIALYSNNYYEVLIRTESRNVPIRNQNFLNKEDNINKLNYSISKPSEEYLIFFLYNLYNQGARNILRRTLMPMRLRQILDKRGTDGEVQLFELDIFDVITEALPRVETIKITSESSKAKIKFEQYIYAFLFNLGYNIDLAITPLRFIDEFIQPYKMNRMRRSEVKDIDFPKRIYNNELILHYQKGISSESIDHQFLSFYHVLEHFFEKIYNDNIINSIKNELIKPSFSYKKPQDISNLVTLIQSKLKYKNDEFLINELEALELTLVKFVTDIQSIKDELNSVDSKLIDYYKTTEVSFSKGTRVNLNMTVDEIFKSLSKRIYMTRNAIVHSKETGKTRYTPFKDDKDLLKELYLMRILAEQVIIQSSEEL